MKRLYLLILFVVCVTQAFSQASNCTQTLRLVRSTYEQGRLHELPSIMDACLKGTGDNAFTKADRREALRYLTLAYIYLEEPEKADEAMLMFLNTEHFYVPSSAVDPAEFIALFNRFRHNPIYRVGIKIGANMTQPTVLEYYNIGSTGGGLGKYGLAGNFHVSLMFEKDLPKLSKKIVVAPEIVWVNRTFTYKNTNLNISDADGTTISEQEFNFKQMWLDLNGIVQYKLENTIDRQTYVGLGPGASLLLASSNQAKTDIGTGSEKYSVTGPAVDDKKSYNKLVYSVTAVVGAKVRFGEFYVTGDVRYQFGISNVVSKSSRTNSEIAFDYQGQYSDYRMSNVMINIGVLIPKFSPKKLIK